jgi:MFS family permease
VSAAARPVTQEEGSAAAVFRNRPFLLLWLSQVATQVGGNMVLYGLTVLVYGETGSTSAVSLLILTFLAPAVIFSALAGVYVDRYDRRLVLVVTNLLRAGLFFALAFLDANILIVFVLNVLVSVVTTFFAPAELSMIPLVVPRSQLTAANGIFTLTLNAAFAVGFTVLGPLLVTIANPTLLVIVVAALYLVAALFCWTLPSAPPGTMPHEAALHEAEAAVGSFVAQFREGIAYVRANPVVSWALLYLGVAASIVGVLGVLGPAFAANVLGLRPKDFVVIVLPMGVGVVTGALGVNALQGMVSRRRLIEAGLLVLGVCLALISIAAPIAQFLRDVNDAVPGPDVSAFVSVLTVVVAIAFIAGTGYAAIAIPAQTELQAELPTAVRGRVFGILNMLVSVGSLLPIIVVGFISEVVGPMPVVLFSAGVITVVGAQSVGRRKESWSDEGTGDLEPIEGTGQTSREVVENAAGPSPEEP